MGYPRGCVHQQQLDAKDPFLLKIGEGKNHDRVLTAKQETRRPWFI